MCDACVGTAAVAYRPLYDATYALDTGAREQYLLERLRASRRFCLPHRLRVSRNVHRMRTQEILHVMSAGCKTEICTAHRTDELLVLHRTRRLTRRILQHAYRPIDGRMFIRCLRDPLVKN
jgi:hypothetical protein